MVYQITLGVTKKRTMDNSHLVRFEEISHVLIEEGFGNFFVKAKIIDSLNLWDKVQLFFEKKIPLRIRLAIVAKRLGPTFTNFAKYTGSRTDLLPIHICEALSDVEYVAHPEKNKQSKTESAKQEKALKSALPKSLKLTKINTSEHRFDGFSYVASAKKSKAEVMVHYIPDVLKKQYLEDIEILFFLAKKIDETYQFDFSARKLVHEYKVHVYERLNLEHNKHFANIYKGALKDKTAVPQYLHASKSAILSKKVQGVPCSDMLTALTKYHHVHESMLDDLDALLLAPVFTHGFLVSEITHDNIIIRKGGKVALNHIPYLQKLDQHHVEELSLIVGALLTKNAGSLAKQFTGNHPAKHAELERRITPLIQPTVSAVHNIFEEIEQLRLHIPKYVHDFFATVKIVEDIAFAFTANKDAIIKLKPQVEKELKRLIKTDLKHQKLLEKAQRELDKKSKLDWQISTLEKKIPIRKTIGLEFLALVIILGSTIFLILSSLNATFSTPILIGVIFIVAIALAGFHAKFKE